MHTWHRRMFEQQCMRSTACHNLVTQKSKWPSRAREGVGLMACRESFCNCGLFAKPEHNRVLRYFGSNLALRFAMCA